MTTFDGVRAGDPPMRLKTLIGRPLQRLPFLHRLASRMYYRVNRRLIALCPEAETVLRKAFDVHRSIVPSEPRDYYEFGVFRGAAFLSAQHVCDELGLDDVRLYGFDSFEGLPPVEGIDRTNSQFFEGQFACSKKWVEKTLARRGFDWSRADLIKGFFSDSLTDGLRSRHPFRKVAVALVDCDLYSSTRDVLSWLRPLLADGSVLLFDDWSSFGGDPGLGQPKAFGEFLDAHSEFRAEELWTFPHHGRAVVLRTADEPAPAS